MAAVVAQATAAPARRAPANPVAVLAVGSLKRWIGRTVRITKRVMQPNPGPTRMKSQPRFDRGLGFHFESSDLEMREPGVSMPQHLSKFIEGMKL